MLPDECLDQMVRLQEDGPAHALTDEKRPETTEQLFHLANFRSGHVLVVVSVRLGLALAHRHHVHLRPVDGARDERLDQGDADTRSQFKHGWALAQVLRCIRLEPLRQADEQGELVRVAGDQPGHVGECAGVEAAK